jgi:hypothetical protein
MPSTGFSNGTVCADNICFNGTRTAQMVTDGDLIYGRTANTPTMLSFVGTATRYLSNTGTGGTLPAWSQINLTNGVTGTLPPTNGGRVTWSVIGVSGTLVVNTGIFCTTGAALSFALPATSIVGDVIEIVLDGSTSWTVTQAANQQIKIGISTTTLGVGGSMTSSAQGDSVMMVCSVANLIWNVVSSMGNPTII